MERRKRAVKIITPLPLIILDSLNSTLNIFCEVSNSPLPCGHLQGCSDGGGIKLLSDLKLKMLSRTQDK